MAGQFLNLILDKQIADLKFQRMNMKSELDSMFKDAMNVNNSVDMVKLGELREKLKVVEEEIVRLQAEVTAMENIQLIPAVPTASVQKEKHRQLDSSFELDNTFHCLQLSICLLEDVEIKTLTPQLRELFNSLVKI